MHISLQDVLVASSDTTPKVAAPPMVAKAEFSSVLAKFSALGTAPGTSKTSVATSGEDAPLASELVAIAGQSAPILAGKAKTAPLTLGAGSTSFELPNGTVAAPAVAQDAPEIAPKSLAGQVKTPNFAESSKLARPLYSAPEKPASATPAVLQQSAAYTGQSTLSVRLPAQPVTMSPPQQLAPHVVQAAHVQNSLPHQTLAPISRPPQATAPVSISFDVIEPDQQKSRASPNVERAPSTLVAATQKPATAVTLATAPKLTFAAEAKPIIGTDGAKLASVSAEGGDPLASEVRSVGSTERQAADVMRHIPDAPRLVSRQIAEGARFLVDRPVELQLNPEELGRVRMTLSREDGGLSMLISAERPETLELMRRNIDMLAQDFQNSGYEDVDFAFANLDSQVEDAPEGAAEHDPDAAVEALPSVMNVLRIQLGGGLDIRL